MKFSVKYGIKSILRAPLKTALFLLLLTIVTAFLTLGVGIVRSAEGMLTDADEVFMTSGEFVYIGGAYPGGSAYDPYAAEADAMFDRSLLSRPEVLMAEESMTHRAVVDGYSPRYGMPFESYAVLYVTAKDAEGQYDWDGRLSPVWDAIYSARQDVKNTLVSLFPEPGSPGQLEHGRSYIVFGRFSDIRAQKYQAFQIEPFESIGISGAPFPPAVEVDPLASMDEMLASEAGVFFSGIAETLRLANNGVDLVVTGSIDAVSQFFNEEYTLVEGEFFKDSADRECIIPRFLARQLEVSPGDSIDISIRYPTKGVGRYSGNETDGGFADESAYVVVGIYLSETERGPIYTPYTGQPWAGHSDTDYTLARVVLDNRSAGAYIDDMQQLLPPGVVFEWGDQGYANAARPILAMREAAMLITVICGAVSLLLIWFFGFFFVYRSRETARVLISLGTRARGILSFFIAGCGLIALVATAAGFAIGYSISGRVAEAVLRIMSMRRDTRFSPGSYGAQLSSFTPEARTTPGSFAAAALSVLLATLLICALFAAARIASQNPHRLQRKKEALMNARAKRSGRTSGRSNGLELGAAPVRSSGRSSGRAHRSATASRDIIPGTSLRYASRTIIRGGGRSAAVPLLFAVLLSFLAVFGNVREGYRERLGSVYDDIPVTAQFTNALGNRFDGLVIDDGQFMLLDSTDYVDDMWHSANWLIRLYEPLPEPLDWHLGEYTFWPLPATPGLDDNGEVVNRYIYETFLDQLATYSSPLVMTDNFSRAPEFRYSGAPGVEFAEGFDWESFYSQFTTDPGTGFKFKTWDEYCEEYLDRYGVYINDYDDLPDNVRLLYTEAGVVVLDIMDLRYKPGGEPHFVIASTRFLEENGLSLGDTALFNICSNDYAHAYQHPFVIGGEFESPINRSSVYMAIQREFVSGGYQFIMSKNADIYFPYRTFSGFQAGGALLKDTRDLSKLKDMLEEDFNLADAFGSKRKWIVVDDDLLYSTIENLNRYIGYMNAIAPMLLALAAAAGFVVSSLLLKGRSAEIAVLRGIGARTGGIFSSLFIEQILLSIPGIAAGIAAPLLFGVRHQGYAMPAVFIVCYFAGVAAAIVHCFGRKAMKSLADREE